MDVLIERLADYLMALPDDVDDLQFKDIEEAIGLQLPVEAESYEWWERFLLLSNSDIDFEWITLIERNPYYLRVSKNSHISNYKRLARSKELFLERWEFTDQEDNFPVFLIRLLNECSKFLSVLSSENEYLNLFCTLLGKSLPKWNDDRTKVIYESIAKTKGVFELAYLLQVLFNILKHFVNYQGMKELKMILLKVLDITSNPPFFLDTDIENGEINIYKGGARLLDDNLVNDSLHWLSKYPEVRRLFANALRNFSKDNLTDEDARSIYEDLRASLEKLIKLILGNSKNLENNKNEIEKWLKEKGTHVHVIRAFNYIMNAYSMFMNDAKHASKYNSNDLEFMVYQTAIMMRMLLEKERS